MTLPCQVTKSFSSRETNSPPVVWKRDKGEVLLKDTDDQEIKDKKPQRVFWDTRPEEQDWAIKITNVTEEDAGMYQCVVINTSETLFVQLEVQGTPFRHLSV